MPRGQKNKKVKARAVRKAHLKKKNVGQPEPKDGDVAMGGTAKVVKETAHRLKKRQAAERRKMKMEVKEMKRQRKTLPKKGQKDAKKVLTQKIRDLLEALHSGSDKTMQCWAIPQPLHARLRSVPMLRQGGRDRNYWLSTGSRSALFKAATCPAMASLHLSHLLSVRSLPLVAIVLGCSQAAPVSAPVGSAQPSFDEYLKHFGKSYDAAEYAERKALYEKRLIEIIKHNSQPGRLWDESVNKFTDARPRKPKLVARHRPDASDDSNETLSHYVAVPAMVDWRTHKPPVLTESRDQGSCGDCWAIAATKALESHLAIATGELLTLSTQAIADCASKGNRRHDCNFGGFAEDAFKHAKNHGVPLQQHYPRLNRGAACKRRTPPAAGVKGHRHLYNRASVMMRTLASRGPVTVGVDSRRWDPYRGGIFDGCSKRATALDHEVLLVGYGEEQGVKYWIVQNSWGTDWGEEGFMRLRRYDNEPCMKDSYDPQYTNCGECGVLAEGTFPLGAFRHSDRRLGAHDGDGIWV